MKNLNLIISLLMLIVLSCSTKKNEKMKLPYSNTDFETVVNGKPTRLFIMENKNGMVVTLTNYGAKIISVYAPGRDGKLADVVLGFKSIAEYQQYSGSHGAVVGPFANRIANAQFTIDSVTYQLPANNGKNCLHSGPASWYRQAWDYQKDGNVVVFSLLSLDGEFGFPGNKTAKVTYTLTDDNELKIDYEVTTDKACHINVTNHAYFNLRGEGNGDVLNHEVVINAKKITPVDSFKIPTGEITDIIGTEFDFTSPHKIAERIDAPHPQLQIANGYDINYVIDKNEGGLAFAASAYEPESGRLMEVFTTEPGVQFFSANHFNGAETGKSGVAYAKRTGFCLETQHFPDSPNHPDFPTTLVNPGEVFRTKTIYKFSAK
jgi:aldose 1-epimerase